MRSIAELLNDLQSLGSAEAIAAKLVSLGCFATGGPACSTCPIARYLQINGWPEAQTNGFSAWSGSVVPPTSTRIPTLVFQFIQNFDSDLYPELAPRTLGVTNGA